jgi:hypothetical protein
MVTYMNYDGANYAQQNNDMEVDKGDKAMG